ncbi:MAG: hypothetical protein WD557_12505 [Dehalococcoidia bacterium]
MPQTFDFPEDAGLAITDFRAVVRTVAGEHQALVDEVTLAWTPPGAASGLMCLSLKHAQPDGTYPGFTAVYPFLGTHHTLSPTVWAVVDGHPAEGFEEVCWQLQAIAEDRVGPPVEVCAAIGNPVLPRGPDDTFPPAVSTPLPVPAPLRFSSVQSDDALGDPETHIDLSWPVTEAIAGTYEVERAMPARPAYPLDHEFALHATLPAAPAADGFVHFEEDIDYVTMWRSPPCYRVRTVINGETGPYSEVRCAVLPPDLRPPASLLPPDAGSGSRSDRGLLPLTLMVAAIGLVAAGSLGLATAAAVASSHR